MSAVAEKLEAVDTYEEKYGIPQVSLGTAKRFLELAIAYNLTRGVICYISHAGIGKSQVVHQVARAYGRRVVDIRTAAFSLLSAGVPQRADPLTGQFDIAVPSDFPRQGEKCIVFFDEINQGQPHALSMFFKLLEDRSLFNYKLPDDCIIVAAMNPSTAQYMVSKIEGLAAYNRRMRKVSIAYNPSEWFAHARTNEFHFASQKPCHPDVISYLEARRSDLYDQKARDQGQQFPCPATWETVSETLYMMETENKKDPTFTTNGQDAEALIASSIGNLVAASFVHYRRDKDILINPTDVLETYASNEPAGAALRARVKKLSEAEAGQINDHVSNVVSLLLEKRPPEAQVAGNYARWWHDLSDEVAASVYTTLGLLINGSSGAEQKKRRDYVNSLTRALQGKAEGVDAGIWYAQMNARLAENRNKELKEATAAKKAAAAK